MERTPEQIQKEIDALHAEVEEIRKQSDLLLDKKASIERQERELKNRLNDISGSWGHRCRNYGLLENLTLELKEHYYPRYDEKRRIIKITGKTITLKYDGKQFDDVTRYSIETGWRSGANSDWNGIDAQKALEIWNAHQGAK